MAAAGPPGAEETAPPPRGHQSAPATAADGHQSRLGVRLRIRHVRGRPDAEVSDDEFTRECLAIDVAGGIRSGRVIEVLTQLVSVHGTPRHLRSDNGPEFVARAILRWLQAAQIETAFIDPGKPWQNGADESFNGKFRDQHLSLQWFRNRADAKVSIEEWRRHYNEVRPHSSLGYLTPAEFKATLAATITEGGSAATPPRPVQEDRTPEDPITLTGAIFQ